MKSTSSSSTLKYLVVIFSLMFLLLMLRLGKQSGASCKWSYIGNSLQLAKAPEDTKPGKPGEIKSSPKPSPDKNQKGGELNKQ